MSAPRALVLDFGGVLTTPLQDAMAMFAEHTGIEMSDVVRAALGAYAGAEDTLVTDFETGVITEEEFSAAFAQRLHEYSGVEVDAHGLVDRLFDTLRLEEVMLELVRRARTAGYKTGLLSNSWGTGLYPHELLRELFDVIVISGEVGLRKPDPAIFELTTERLGLEGSECVFVDDHPDHLKAAAAAGMTTVLHRGPTETVKELEELLGL